MLQKVGRMRNNLSTYESDSKPKCSFSFILLAWITTKGDSGFMKRSNTPVIILVDKIPSCFQSIEAEKTPLTRRHPPRPQIPFLRKGIGIRIWMPQWIQILDYADSYAYFVDYDAEGLTHFFYSRFFIFIWNWFTNHFLLCGSGGLGSLGLAIPGKS